MQDLSYINFVFTDTTENKVNYVEGDYTYVYYSLSKDDKDFLDKLTILLRDYNANIMKYHNISIIYSTQEEINCHRKPIFKEMRLTQFDIYIRSLKYFSTYFDDTFANYVLTGVLETLSRLLKFNEKSIVDINKVITQLTRIIDSNCLNIARKKYQLQ